LSTLTDNLVELDEEFARVMAKVRKVDDDKRDLIDTIECTPAKNTIHCKTHSFLTTPKKN
jgi:hypothetical protein